MAKWLLPTLNTSAIESTGRLFPRGSLKKPRVRSVVMPWLHKVDGKLRYLTKPVLRNACVEIVALLGFTPPRAPTQSYHDYIDQQARRLADIIRAGKKHSYDRDLVLHAALPRPFKDQKAKAVLATKHAEKAEVKPQGEE